MKCACPIVFLSVFTWLQDRARARPQGQMMHSGHGAAASGSLCVWFLWGELFGLGLSKAREPANAGTDPVLSASGDTVVVSHRSEVCEKAVLTKLYSKIIQNCWVY